MQKKCTEDTIKKVEHKIDHSRLRVDSILRSSLDLPRSSSTLRIDSPVRVRSRDFLSLSLSLSLYLSVHFWHSVTCVELPGTEWEASTRGTCTWTSCDLREIGGTSTVDRGRGVTGSAPANILAIYKASSALSDFAPCRPARYYSPASRLIPPPGLCASDIPPAVLSHASLENARSSTNWVNRVLWSSLSPLILSKRPAARILPRGRWFRMVLFDRLISNAENRENWNNQRIRWCLCKDYIYIYIYICTCIFLVNNLN